MIFSDLLSIDYDEGSNVIDRQLLALLLPDTPEEVRNVYAEHGRKDQFQSQYGALDIAKLSWSLVDITAADVRTVSINPNFSNWVGAVADRVSDFANLGWACIDTRKDVVNYWTSNETWLFPPVLLDGRLLGKGGGLHLMEGHTRVGVLCGLVNHQIVKGSSMHKIWRGSF